MLRGLLVLGFCALALAARPTHAADGAPVGIVKSVSGDIAIVRGGDETAPAVGSDIFLNDTVRTGADGRIGISLNDSTTLSLGEDSRLTIDEFVYEPAQDNVALGLSMASGTMTYLSGKIAAIRPESIRVETPYMVVGVRGTKFLVKVD